MRRHGLSLGYGSLECTPLSEFGSHSTGSKGILRAADIVEITGGIDTVLEAYRAHVAERAELNIPAKPLTAEQVAGLIDLIKNPVYIPHIFQILQPRFRQFPLFIRKRFVYIVN